MCPLESPRRGDSNEYTQHIIIVQRIEKISLNHRNLPSDLALRLTLSGSNYPYLEQNSMVLKMFEPLKFDWILNAVGKNKGKKHMNGLSVIYMHCSCVIQ